MRWYNKINFRQIWTILGKYNRLISPQSKTFLFSAKTRPNEEELLWLTLLPLMLLVGSLMDQTDRKKLLALPNMGKSHTLLHPCPFTFSLK